MNSAPLAAPIRRTPSFHASTPITAPAKMMKAVCGAASLHSALLGIGYVPVSVSSGGDGDDRERAAGRAQRRVAQRREVAEAARADRVGDEAGDAGEDQQVARAAVAVR